MLNANKMQLTIKIIHSEVRKQLLKEGKHFQLFCWRQAWCIQANFTVVQILPLVTQKPWPKVKLRPWSAFKKRFSCSEDKHGSSEVRALFVDVSCNVTHCICCPHQCRLHSHQCRHTPRIWRYSDGFHTQTDLMHRTYLKKQLVIVKKI